MNIEQLSDDQLLASLEQEFVTERNASHNILLHLKEVQSRRLYAKRGFPNLFTMLMRHYRQSETSANQRVKALTLMLEVPAVEDGLVSGDLNLSTVAMAQRQIQREEKLSGTKVSEEKKAEIVESITGKTIAQAEVELFKHLPETASDPKTFERRVSETATRMNMTVPDDVRDMMIRLKEIWTHVDPNMDNVEVMRRAFKLALEKVDPTLRKKAAPRPSQSATDSVKRRGSQRLTFYGKEFDRILWEWAQSQCEYIDQKTGRRCECKSGLQREHKIPLAMGGTNELSNMELLCLTHNQLRAREVFGNSKIDRYTQSARKT